MEAIAVSESTLAGVICVAERYSSYRVTPTSSAEAVHATVTLARVSTLAITVLGTLGGVVSTAVVPSVAKVTVAWVAIGLPATFVTVGATMIV